MGLTTGRGRPARTEPAELRYRHYGAPAIQQEPEQGITAIPGRRNCTNAGHPHRAVAHLAARAMASKAWLSRATASREIPIGSLATRLSN